MAYQCAIDAVSDLCFPSYALRAGRLPLGALPPMELSFIGDFLERGFAVSIADHEGRLGVFGAPREPGRRVLDGVRASLAFAPAGLAQETPVGLFGYSGGGMASAWAAQEAPAYAPEIDLVGAVLGSPVGDPGEAFVKLNGTFFAGLPAMVVAGLAEVYPGIDRVIEETATENGSAAWPGCGASPPPTPCCATGTRTSTTSSRSPGRRPGAPRGDRGLRRPALGHDVPQCPLLVVQATRDLIIDARDVDDLVERYVAGGATVRYVRDHTSEHIGLMVLAQPMMLAWMEARFEAVPAPSGEAASALLLDPRSWPGYLSLLGTTLRLLSGRGGSARRRGRRGGRGRSSTGWPRRPARPEGLRGGRGSAARRRGDCNCRPWGWGGGLDDPGATSPRGDEAKVARGIGVRRGGRSHQPHSQSTRPRSPRPPRPRAVLPDEVAGHLGHRTTIVRDYPVRTPTPSEHRPGPTADPGPALAPYSGGRSTAYGSVTVSVRSRNR